jgi:YesN/AraC family two-component response regulator
MSVNRAQALAAGCDDFLLKPVDRTTLFKVIERLIHQSPESENDRQPTRD